MDGRYTPDLDAFCELAKQGNLVPVLRELPADLETPVSVFLKLRQRAPTFLLESVEGGEKVGRYSFLGAGNMLVVESSGRQATIRRPGTVEKVALEGKDALRLVQELLAQYRVAAAPGLPRFFGGAVGYLGYDMVRFFERLPEPPRDELGLPDCMFIFTEAMLIFDHVQRRIKVVANAHVNGAPEEAYRQAVARIEDIVVKLARPLPRGAASSFEGSPASQFELMQSNFTHEQYADVVRACKEYVYAGDIFQVVPSQRLRRRTIAEPFAIYRALRMLNPSPYMFYLDLGKFHLVGSSPEMLIRVENGVAESRPIAGTRRRGASEAEDEALGVELLADPKERAEHVMLVDLARNDLGRVCEYGTVRVPEYMIIEKYSHVMHIVSSVQGKLRASEDAFSFMRSAFPAGTLTGAPKIRAMEIITEMEQMKRGPYGGAVGYFSFTGNMDTCITIRTVVMIGDTVYLQAGGGVVADSEPDEEYQETLNKLKAVERAVALAEFSQAGAKQPVSRSRAR